MKLIFVTKCECGNEIVIKWKEKFVHVKCDKCNRRYHLDQVSRKRYLFVTPMIIIGMIVLNRLVFNIQDIALLALYILGGSYLISHTINRLLLKNRYFDFERELNSR